MQPAKGKMEKKILATFEKFKENKLKPDEYGIEFGVEMTTSKQKLMFFLQELRKKQAFAEKDIKEKQKITIMINCLTDLDIAKDEELEKMITDGVSFQDLIDWIHEILTDVQPIREGESLPKDINQAIKRLKEYERKTTDKYEKMRILKAIYYLEYVKSSGNRENNVLEDLSKIRVEELPNVLTGDLLYSRLAVMQRALDKSGNSADKQALAKIKSLQKEVYNTQETLRNVTYDNMLLNQKINSLKSDLQQKKN